VTTPLPDPGLILEQDSIGVPGRLE